MALRWEAWEAWGKAPGAMRCGGRHAGFKAWLLRLAFPACGHPATPRLLAPHAAPGAPAGPASVAPDGRLLVGAAVGTRQADRERVAALRWAG